MEDPMNASIFTALTLTLPGLISPAAAQPSPAVQTAAPNGEALYKEHCASCRDTGVPRAASRAALSRIAPDSMGVTLTKGTMATQVSKLTPPPLEAVIRFLGDSAPAASAT